MPYLRELLDRQLKRFGGVHAPHVKSPLFDEPIDQIAPIPFLDCSVFDVAAILGHVVGIVSAACKGRTVRI